MKISSLTKKELGNIGEEHAKNFLINKGMQFITSNYFTAKGEIDLIFIDQEILVFVEVKTRLNKNYFENSILKAKAKKIYQTAKLYIEKQQPVFKEIRFDVIFIEINHRGRVVEIGHRPNFL